MNIIFVLFFFQIFLISVKSRGCVFYQHCDNHISTASCHVPVKSDFEPKFVNFTTDFMCPDLADGPVCCDDDQNFMLTQNFQMIDFSFGSGIGNASLGGCDICAANLKRFWCQFTCSPNQSDFVVAMKVIQTPSPVQPGVMLTVLNTTVTMNSDTVCALYDSCNKTQYVTQVAAMSTASGFVNFQGSQAVTIGKAYINVNYSIDPTKSLTLELYQCNQTFKDHKDPSGYPVRKACTCNNCDLACTSVNMDSVVKKNSLMKGFNVALVLIIYIGALLFAMALIVYRYLMKMNKRKIALTESHFEEESNLLKDKSE